MSVEQKKCVAVAAFSGGKTITQIAKEIESSRKFFREQKAIVAGAVDAAFHPEPTPNKVLFHLPVTRQWMEPLVLSPTLIHVSYRHVSTLLTDVFDCTISIATVNNIFNAAVRKVHPIHATEDLSRIDVTANDELFHLKNLFYREYIRSRYIITCYQAKIDTTKIPGRFILWIVRTRV
ncbi:MAG: hypothetical protein ACI9Y1_001094 [Lentisphaeria bacterium]|jgi:hypothetical protein